MTGRNYYFLATGLSSADGVVCDTDEEFIGRVDLSFDEVERLIEEDRRQVEAADHLSAQSLR
jgi:ADP-ribose pyrophosphatase